jgi:uncharacterized protein YndB with AHSA1/START domain
MSGEGSTIEREIFIAAAPETVFEFLIDPALMAQWIGSLHQLDARPGGIFQAEVSPGNIARGTYVEVVPFSRVAFSWGWVSHDPELAALRPGASLVEIELEPKNGGTLLRLRHSGLPDALANIHRDRWSLYLGRLENLHSKPAQADTASVARLPDNEGTDDEDQNAAADR